MSTRFVGIDPATTTGLCILDIDGNPIVEADLRGKGEKEPGGLSIAQLVDLENQLIPILQPGDEIAVESAAFGTNSAVTAGMIHGGIRSIIHRKKLAFSNVNPTSTKKYVGVTGWIGEKGNKRRLKDDEKKAAVKAAVLDLFGYSHKSHNVVDAYVIARIARSIYLRRELLPAVDTQPYQIEVVRDILEGKAPK
ncbi:crossover junction endodeoxyribonuclease RuvC [Cohnella sp. OV330]|uniref:hypothetical protein n=1 Tax=Cohnella sp. OV330 TaxID=1855288 RepID=UPI0008DEADF7|nr:hypothetical protein [Cohnella sp. OV330]SFA90956.1 crossover junction endodeoxyribonuclease RuvC [Cohnella sp. OV330]